MTELGRCLDCSLPIKADRDRCAECAGIAWAEKKTAQIRELNTRLPPRSPELRSIPFCACGALSRLATWHGVTRCADCWRRAA